jgi:hypothetical protein
MAERLVFVIIGDPSHARRILDSFAGETGLAPQSEGDVTRFALDGADHRVKVVQTLTEIDPDWSRHLSLGPPEASG